MEVTLRIHSVDGTNEVRLTSNRLTLGRTDAADVVINDPGLSRVHASINRDGDRIWVIDEGSTNGTLVNGTLVPAIGLVLSDGDEIELGQTAVVVSFKQPVSVLATPTGTPYEAPNTSGVPTAVIAAAAGIVLILFAAIIIGVASRSSSDSEQLTVKKYGGPLPSIDQDVPGPTTEPIPSATNDPANTASPPATEPLNIAPITPPKKYPPVA